MREGSVDAVKSLAEVNEADWHWSLVLLAFLRDMLESEDLLSTWLFWSEACLFPM